MQQMSFKALGAGDQVMLLLSLPLTVNDIAIAKSPNPDIRSRSADEGCCSKKNALTYVETSAAPNVHLKRGS